MRDPTVKTWFSRLPELNRPQRQKPLAALHPAAGLDRVVALIAEIGPGKRGCPDCAWERFNRHGQANGLPRYRCRACNPTYNDLTGTPLAKLHLRSKWLDYLGAGAGRPMVSASIQ